ncbi:hypothetical protein CoNPh36_CDS0013 [Staphylococcus phage S-CoN_Ph36]|nr:hypothetical protein CoNPh36_CDS0013 [Staphylococcus phage S-CoN_Ph36]
MPIGKIEDKQEKILNEKIFGDNWRLNNGK